MDCDWLSALWAFVNSQFISSLVASGIGAFIALKVAGKTLSESARQIQEKFALERMAKYRQIVNAVLAELEENIALLSSDPHNPALLLSDTAWQQGQGLILSLDSDAFGKCAVAYKRIKSVMSVVQLRLNGQGGLGSAYNHDSEVKTIEAAKSALTRALGGL